jgi:predicted DNA-binding transcriptional regulator AlpA
MTFESHLAQSEPRAAPADPDYWHTLIDEKAAAEFLGLTDRTMQALRQRGGGPQYIALSSRCLRYRRIDLRKWAEARVRTSTSDPGQATA